MKKNDRKKKFNVLKIEPLETSGEVLKGGFSGSFSSASYGGDGANWLLCSNTCTTNNCSGGNCGTNCVEGCGGCS
ncbi:MAG: hypothetical protein LBQ84_08650 [Flavobacteriaceae bacterium]|jgi:hypothetical protein|nr:hypothetical protein [Flavobacteriaceae bacterium]